MPENLLAWFASADAVRLLSTVVVPFVAIIVAGVIAALIARSAVRGVVNQADRDATSAAVAGIVAAARRLAASSDRAPAAQRSAERLAIESDIRLRLSRVQGAAQAADWAQGRLARVRPAIATGGATAAVAEIRDELTGWLANPRSGAVRFAPPVQPAPPAARKSGRKEAAPAESAAATPLAPVPAELPAAAMTVADAPVAPPRVAATDAAQAAEQPSAVPGVVAPPKSTAGQPIPGPKRTGAPAMPTNPLAPATAAVALTDAKAAARPTASEPTTDTAPLQRPSHSLLAGTSGNTNDDHLHARHALDNQTPVFQPPTSPTKAVPPAASAPASAPAAMTADGDLPAWLDTYDGSDDDREDSGSAEMPPPVSASGLRDRAPIGDGLVPRQ